MSRHCILLLIVGFVLQLAGRSAQAEATPEQVRRWREEAKARHVEAHARLFQVAMTSLRQQQPAAYDALPVALRDSLPWWLDAKPAGEWSEATRAFVLQCFREAAVDPDTQREEADRLRAWLAEGDPFANARIQFVLMGEYQLSGGNHDHGVFFSLPGGSGIAVLPLDALVQSLTDEQLASLTRWPPLSPQETRRGVPWPDLTAEQRDLALQAGGVTSRESFEKIASFPDAVVRLNFHLKLYVTRPSAGDPEAKELFEANLSWRDPQKAEKRPS